MLLFLYLLPATKRETSRVDNRRDFLHRRRRRTLLYRRRRRLCHIPTLHIHPNNCMIITINLNPLISRPNSPIPPTTLPLYISPSPSPHHPSIQPRLGHIPPRTGLQHFRLTIPNPTTTQFRIKIPFRKISLTNHNPIGISAIICDILNFPPDFFFW